MKCKNHPDAPHGFMRDASHSADRYVCECESWEPPKNKPMTRAEWKEWLEESWNEAQKLASLHGGELHPMPVQEFARAVEPREWVGLTDDVIEACIKEHVTITDPNLKGAVYMAIQTVTEKLREMNT